MQGTSLLRLDIGYVIVVKRLATPGRKDQEL